MLISMQKELDIYQAKIRFIEEFISGEINILQKEDEEIEQMLMERNFPKFGKDAEYDDKKNNDIIVAEDMNYNYLLNMKIKSLTKKKIEELKKLFENKLALYNELNSKSEKDLWKDDLNNFLSVYKKKLEEYNNLIDDQIKNINNQKSKTSKGNAKKVSAKK